MLENLKSQEWTAKPGELLEIPAEYLVDLKWDIMVLSSKKVTTLQCREYDQNGVCHGVIWDTSETNARGKVTLQRVSYHEVVYLVNVGFMAIPIPTPESPDSGASQTQEHSSSEP